MTIDMVLRSPSLCIPVKFSAYSELAGKDGVGVPTGGKTGQVLKKKSDTDFDTEWQDDIAGSGGTVVTLEGVAQPTFPADSFVDDAIAKKVVDGAPSNLDTFGKVASALVGKVDKYEGQYSRIYGTANGGKQMMYEVSSGAGKYTIAYRGADGVLGVGTAKDPTHAVPLAQMNEALTAKAGAEVEGKVDSLEKKVDNLLVGQAPDMFFDDDATAYVKEIPEDVAPYAAVKSVGGMIHAHQLPPPNLFNASVLDAEQSKDGINFWVGGSGVYSVTPDDYFSSSPFVTTAKFKEIFPNSVVGKKYTLTYDAEYSYDAVYGTTAGSIYPSGTFTLTNEIWESGLEMGVAAFYEQADTYYGETTYSNISLTEEGGGERYLTEAKVTALEIRGANLLKYPYREKSQTVNGVTFTDNGDGRVTVNGTATETTLFRLETDKDLHPNLVYTLSGAPNVSGVILYITYAKNGAWYKEYYNAGDKNATFTTEEGCTYNVKILVNRGATINNAVVRPMLNAGDTAVPFSIYHEPHTFAIPEAVQALDGYGWGIKSNVYNRIEWDEDGKPTFVKRVGRVVLTGTETWVKGEYQGAVNYGVAPSNYSTYGATVSNRFPLGLPNNGIPCMHDSGASVVFYTTNPPATVEGWKALLAQWEAEGNPLTVYYELAEPIVTDISHLITDDNLIPVEGGGVIVAQNENEEAAPTTIRYQVTGATLADAFDQIHEYAMQKIGGTT